MLRTLPLLCSLLFALIVSSALQARAQSVVVNEFMASNDRTVADEDGDYPDWIELYNAGNTAVDLKDFGLSDKADDPFRWRLPSIVLPPEKHLLIFASGKDRAGTGANEWHTIIDQGHTFKYFVGTSAPPFTWRSRTFDDSPWSAGPTPIGYEQDPNGATLATTVPTGTISLFVRTTFIVQDPSKVVDAVLHVDYDDGFVAYLNGAQIARGNMPGSAIPAHTTLAPENREALIYQGGYPERYPIPDIQQRLNPAGDNVLAIQVHNVSANSSDLTLIPFLSLSFADGVPDGPGPSPLLPPNLSVPPHTNFSLDIDGEMVLLTDPSGSVVDSISFGPQVRDQSMGRMPDGGSEWAFYLEPTPGSANDTEGFTGPELAPPEFSLPAGNHPAGTLVGLSSPDGAQIVYTTSGRLPTSTSTRYASPLPLARTTVIRARAIQEGSRPSPVVTRTFLVNENPSIPIVSLTTDSLNLWDYETGIYANGPGWTPQDPHFGANFWQNWEIPMYVEFFEPDGSYAISQEGGARIYGAWSRARPQKSLALFARSRYGSDRFRHRIWPTRNIDSFVSIVLRNSGNDWNQLHFRDAFMQALVDDLEFETLAYRPAHVYLNGAYWGILNLREKANEYLVAGYHGVDAKAIDLLEMGASPLANEGTTEHYDALVSYLQSNNASQAHVYEHVKTQMDVNSFIDYQAAEIYLVNTDWPGNNNKFWRPQTDDGRYRWILFDTDFGFGLYSGSSYYNHPTLSFATEPNGPGWPNPPAATFLFRELLKNQEFRHAVINRFADLMNHHFDPERVLAIFDEMAAAVEQEMPRQFARWGGSMNSWRGRRASIEDFGNRRPGYFWTHLRTFFSLLAQQRPVTVNVDHQGRGAVRVNRLRPEAFPWTGNYLPSVPLQIEALPRPGHRFVGWSGTSESTERLLTVDPGDVHNLTAHFEVDLSVPDPIMFSEIHYRPADDHPTGDWVELYNPRDFAVDLSGWTFRDENVSHLFVIPQGTTISANGFLVLAQDPDAFRLLHPNVPNMVGGWDFGLSRQGEAIILRSPNGELVDSLTYGADAPWPADPDGNGPTLELTDFTRDNTIPRNWQSSKVRGGSPGTFNTVGVGVDVEEEGIELPREVALSAIYPNPFQGTATIPYALPRPAHVRLQVYNVLGQLVGTLVDGPAQAGSHAHTWMAGRLAPGTYFVRLAVDGAGAETRSVVLVR